jgi:hypothetical protein
MDQMNLSPVKYRLFQAAVQIKDAPFDTELAFTPRELVQATLPHKDPGNIPRWLRQNGHYALIIQPGWDRQSDSSIGYPYGTIPRLLMFWLTTEALRTGSRQIELGENLTHFMRQIGLSPDNGTGKRSDTKRLRDQMQRLFRARISFEYAQKLKGKNYRSHLEMQVASATNLWWSDQDSDCPIGFGCWMEIGEHFFTAITENPVPIDMRALHGLKNSPFALDLYAWSAHTAFRASRQGKPSEWLGRALWSKWGRNTPTLRTLRSPPKPPSKKFNRFTPTSNWS